MREILFRGKRLDNGEWVEGNLFVPDNVTRAAVPTEILIGTNRVRISYEVDPDTVGQYTGLADKSGVKIFEGDIFRHPLDSRSIYVVSWDKGGGFTIFTDDTGFDPKCIEIIGNIHDNQGLLRR